MCAFYPPPETLIPLHKILPSEPLLLMGAGPVPIPHAVAQANSVVINHLGDTMDRVIARVKLMAQYAFQTKSEKVMGVAGPASAAMEMGITNLLWPGRKVLVLQNGTFSNRMGEMAEAVGAETTYVTADSTKSISVEDVEKALARDTFDFVTLVQGETSCGVINRELPEIVRKCKESGALVMIDAVCTLSTMPMKMDEWNVDILVTGGQKGISSIPGVALIAFSQAAWKIIENRKAGIPHWCLDALRADKFWGEQEYHYTAPVPGILAMHEALRIICEETLEERFFRHRICSEALQRGIEIMGLDFFVKPEYRLNSVIAIELPKGINGKNVRKTMADQFNVEISGSFGLNVIRIGQMGEQCRSHNLFKTLYALGMGFRKEGFAINLSEGMAAMEEHLAQDPNHFVQ